MKGKSDKEGRDPWRLTEAARRQLREDGRRPLAVNLAEAIELSEFVSSFPAEHRPADAEAREMLRSRNVKD